MNEENTIPDEWLVRAFATSDDCPEPESYLEEVSQGLTVEERERNDRHADDCPVCATERDLARSFDASQGDDADIDYIVARLEQSAAGLPDALRGPRLFRTVPVWALAAAALVVLGVLGVLRPTGPDAPGLPTFGSGAVTRGTHVDVIQPVGDLEAMPGSLSWRALSDAETYHIRLMRVDDTVLWEASVDGASVELSEAVSDNLRPRVAYFWEVEALTGSGTRVGLSDRIRFRVVPPPVSGSGRHKEGEEQR